MKKKGQVYNYRDGWRYFFLMVGWIGLNVFTFLIPLAIYLTIRVAVEHALQNVRLVEEK